MVPPFLPLHIEGTAARFGPDDSCPWLHCSHRHTYCLLLSHQKSVFFGGCTCTAANHPNHAPAVAKDSEEAADNATCPGSRRQTKPMRRPAKIQTLVN